MLVCAMCCCGMMLGWSDARTRIHVKFITSIYTHKYMYISIANKLTASSYSPFSLRKSTSPKITQPIRKFPCFLRLFSLAVRRELNVRSSREYFTYFLWRIENLMYTIFAQRKMCTYERWSTIFHALYANCDVRVVYIWSIFIYIFM